MDLRNVEQAIRSIIRELVEWLIITWLTAQVLAVVTAGASEAIAAANSAAETPVAMARALSVVEKLKKVLIADEKTIEALKARGTLGKAAARGTLGKAAEWVLRKGMHIPTSRQGLSKTPIKAVTGLDGHYISEPLSDLADGIADAVADEADDRLRGDDSDSRWLRRAASGIADPIVDAVTQRRGYGRRTSLRGRWEQLQEERRATLIPDPVPPLTPAWAMPRHLIAAAVGELHGGAGPGEGRRRRLL
ncbi:MAG: hypothetical protein P8Z68_06445 [Kineosporiaceae bacterium]